MARVEIDVSSLFYINSDGLKITILKNEIKFCNYNIERRNNCIAIKIYNKPVLSFGIPNYLMFEVSNIDEKNDWVAILNSDATASNPVMQQLNGINEKLNTVDGKLTTVDEKLTGIDANMKKDEITGQQIYKGVKKIDKLVTLIADTTN